MTWRLRRTLRVCVTIAAFIGIAAVQSRAQSSESLRVQRILASGTYYLSSVSGLYDDGTPFGYVTPLVASCDGGIGDLAYPRLPNDACDDRLILYSATRITLRTDGSWVIAAQGAYLQPRDPRAEGFGPTTWGVGTCAVNAGAITMSFGTTTIPLQSVSLLSSGSHTQLVIADSSVIRAFTPGGYGISGGRGGRLVFSKASQALIVRCLNGNAWQCSESDAMGTRG